MTFANQTQPPNGNAPRDTAQGAAATQFVGRGTTKLNVTLWFDVTAELPPALAELAGNPPDVRRLTSKIVELLASQPTGRENQPVPPQVRFLWGSFQFDGLIDSIDPTLEVFSPPGVPPRRRPRTPSPSAGARSTKTARGHRRRSEATLAEPAPRAFPPPPLR